MRTSCVSALFVSMFLTTGCADPDRDGPRSPDIIFRGASDASAAVSLNQDLVIVGDDENNTLRVYKTTGGLPVSTFDLTETLDVNPEHPEADIEGATAVGDRVYWITSHGRNKDGEMRPNRYRFFATDVKVGEEGASIAPVGVAFTGLAAALVAADVMGAMGLETATQFGAEDLSETALAHLAPKAEGLNIEGLCASADGSELFVGLRNPRPIDKVTGRPNALVARLKNAEAIIMAEESPVFGEPMVWDLDGFGIRSIDYVEQTGDYWVVAGSADEGPGFALYRWSGRPEEQPVLAADLDRTGLHPEALATFKGMDAVLLVSDDGTLPVDVSSPTECMSGELHKGGSCPNKSLADPMRKTFRGAWLPL